MTIANLRLIAATVGHVDCQMQLNKLLAHSKNHLNKEKETTKSMCGPPGPHHTAFELLYSHRLASIYNNKMLENKYNKTTVSPAHNLPPISIGVHIHFIIRVYVEPGVACI